MNYNWISWPLSIRSFGFFFRIAARNSLNSLEIFLLKGNWTSSVT